MINSESDYDKYLVRCGLRDGAYEHSETIIKKSFEGSAKGVSAKDQALAFVEEARKSLDKQSVGSADNKSEKAPKPSKKGGAK